MGDKPDFFLQSSTSVIPLDGLTGAVRDKSVPIISFPHQPCWRPGPELVLSLSWSLENSEYSILPSLHFPHPNPPKEKNKNKINKKPVQLAHGCLQNNVSIHLQAPV